MTGDKNSPSAIDAKALRERAGDWLERRDRPDWSVEDQANFDVWLAASSANLVAYWRVEGAWERAQRLRAVHPPHSPPPQSRTARRGWSIFSRVAAGFVTIAVAVSAVALFGPKSHEQLISTPLGGHRSVVLGDGSHIELNTDTVIRVDVAADHRLASVERGEVYFQVAHDARHPFVVAAGDHRITVLGTKFLVRQNPDSLEVALLDGRIWLDAGPKQPNSHGLLLMPGDDIVSTAQSFTRVKKPAEELQGELSWRSGMLVFKYTALSDAAAEFNRYNTKKLVVADNATARLKIIGKFPTNDPDMFVRASRQLFNLRVETRGDIIVLSR